MMKKLLMSIAAVAISSVAFAEDTDLTTIDNTLYLDKVTASAGSQATVSLKMKNTAAGIQAIGAYVTLPAGVTISAIELGSRAPEAEEGVVFAKTNRVDGVDRIALLSGNGVALTDNDGEVIKLTLDVASTVENGDYDISISNMELCNNENAVFGKDLTVVSTLTVGPTGLKGDVNKDNEVDVADAVEIYKVIAAGTYNADADVNEDTEVDVADAVEVYKIIAQ